MSFQYLGILQAKQLREKKRKLKLLRIKRFHYAEGHNKYTESKWDLGKAGRIQPFSSHTTYWLLFLLHIRESPNFSVIPLAVQQEMPGSGQMGHIPKSAASQAKGNAIHRFSMQNTHADNTLTTKWGDVTKTSAPAQNISCEHCLRWCSFIWVCQEQQLLPCQSTRCMGNDFHENIERSIWHSLCGTESALWALKLIHPWDTQHVILASDCWPHLINQNFEKW